MGIPVGYQLHISSWENDGDSRKTKIIEGLTEEDVKFYLDIAKNFTSRNNHWDKKDYPTYGNGGIKNEDLARIVKEALIAHPNISQPVRDEWTPEPEAIEVDDGADWYFEALTEFILGYPDYEGYWDQVNFCRVFDSFKVFYIPAQAEEVTDKFKVQ